MVIFQCFSVTDCRVGPLIIYPHHSWTFYAFQRTTPQYILTYKLTVQMILLTPVLKKLHKERSAVPNWVVFFITRHFVKRNNAEFTNICSFTLLLMCSMRFTLSCRILPTAFPVCVCSYPRRVCLGSCLGSLVVGCFSVHLNSSELNLLEFWTSDIWVLAISCRKFLHIMFCLCVVFQQILHYY